MNRADDDRPDESRPIRALWSGDKIRIERSPAAKR